MEEKIRKVIHNHISESIKGKFWIKEVIKDDNINNRIIINTTKKETIGSDLNTIYYDISINIQLNTISDELRELVLSGSLIDIDDLKKLMDNNNLYCYGLTEDFELAFGIFKINLSLGNVELKTRTNLTD